MRYVKHKKIRIKDGSVDLDADINATVAVNTGTGSQTTHASSHSEAAVFQGRRKPERDEPTNPSETTTDPSDPPPAPEGRS